MAASWTRRRSCCCNTSRCIFSGEDRVDGVTGPGPPSKQARLATALLGSALRAACLEGGRSSLTLMVLRSQRDEPRSKHQGETNMEHYAGIDVSLEYSSVCVVDASGKILREARVASGPEARVAWFRSSGFEFERIGLEAGPLSQWLFAGMKAAGLAVELLETRHVRKAFEAMPVKSDRNDARGIAQLMRLGWFRPVHCKSLSAQETRAIVTARKVVQSKLHDVENRLPVIPPGCGPNGVNPARLTIPAGSARSATARCGRRSTRPLTSC